MKGDFLVDVLESLAVPKNDVLLRTSEVCLELGDAVNDRFGDEVVVKSSRVHESLQGDWIGQARDEKLEGHDGLRFVVD